MVLACLPSPLCFHRYGSVSLSLSLLIQILSLFNVLYLLVIVMLSPCSLCGTPCLLVVFIPMLGEVCIPVLLCQFLCLVLCV